MNKKLFVFGFLGLLLLSFVSAELVVVGLPLSVTSTSTTEEVAQEPIQGVAVINSVGAYNQYGGLLTRKYLFVGETIKFVVSGVESSKSAGVYVNGLIEAGCSKIATDTFRCIYSVEPIARGQSEVSVRITDIYGDVYETPKVSYYFNPGMINMWTFSYPVLTNKPVEFLGTLKPGYTVYSDNINAYVNKEGGASAKIYIKGKSVYSTRYPRIACPYSNSFSPSNIQYTLNNGATWKALTTSYAYIGTDSANIKFKLKIPSPCDVLGYDFDSAIVFYSEVLK